MLLAFAAAGSAQWVLPSKTPQTEVLCSTCPGVDPSMKTVGYKLPFATFTGRFLDSTNVSDWFLPVRTLRATSVLPMPALNRLYFRMGNGTIAAYALDTFFSRLEANEPPVFPLAPVPADRGENPEKILRWDNYFNPELSGSGWQTVNIDGGTRVTAFDVDDQAYVYIASVLYGWGIVKDRLTSNAAMMTSQYQKFPSSGEPLPIQIIAAKDAAHDGAADKYYAFVGSSSASKLWDVTDRTSPLLVDSNDRPHIQSYAKNSTASSIAILDKSGRLRINNIAGWVANNQPPVDQADNYRFVTSDGTNFYALTGSNIAVFRPGGDGGYTQEVVPLPNPLYGITGFRYSDGYLAVMGYNAKFAWTVRLYAATDPTRLSEVRIADTAGTEDFFASYYGAPPRGYATPGFINSLDGIVYRGLMARRAYFIFCAKGLGDVYELSTFGAPNSVTATTIGGSSLNVRWQTVTDAVSYRLYSAPAKNGPYSLVGETTVSEYNGRWMFSPYDTAFFRVEAVDASANVSPLSTAFDFTVAAPFTDDPLFVSAPIKAAHINELRLAVNSLRRAAGLTEVTFTDPVIDSSTPIRAIHITELRTGLDEARFAMGTYWVPLGLRALTSGMPVRAIDFDEVRAGLR